MRGWLKLALLAAGAIGLVVAALAMSWTPAEPSKPPAPSTLCDGVFDESQVSTELGLGVVADTDTHRGVSLNGGFYDDGQWWECNIVLPEGRHIRLETKSPSLEGILAVADAPVSVGNGRDGAIWRTWRPDYGTRPYGGYLAFPCKDGTLRDDERQGLPFAVWSHNPESEAAQRAPSYRQMAVLFTMAANGLRKHFGCEGKPYSVPDLPSRPTHTPIGDLDKVCDTFPRQSLEPLLPGADNGSTQWREWRSPGDTFPSTSCQVWRDATADEEERYRDDVPAFGPMISFARGSGAGAEALTKLHASSDLRRSKEWPTPLAKSGTSSVAGSKYSIRRPCKKGWQFYTGEFADGTVARAQFEKLFDQWVRAQAKRDGCPIEQR